MPETYSAYVVRPGDTLSAIARKYGFSNPLLIYNDPANAAIRQRRPSPNLIQPGDRIAIPANRAMQIQNLQKQLQSLLALRHDSDATFLKIEQELDQVIRKYKTVSETADAAAMVAGIVVSMTQIVAKGMAAMKLSGAALEQANSELAKDAVKFSYEPLEDPALRGTAAVLGAHPNTAALLGKATIEAFLNIQSPSFWAGVWGNLRSGMSWSKAVTTDPLDTIIETRNRIELQRQATDRSLDQKIQQIRQLL
jgi:LysM repeat protein